MEATYIGFNMWVKAVEKAKSTDPDKVIDALPGTETANLTGGVSKRLPTNHITKPVFIGEIKPNGQFDVVWKTPGLVAGDAWSKELPDSKDLIGDWVGKKCGNYNTKINKCGGQGSSSTSNQKNFQENETRKAAMSPPSTTPAGV